MFSVVGFTLYSIALARWPQENFDLMIKIMQTSLAQGHSSIKSLLVDRESVTHTKHVKARAKQDVKARRYVMVFFPLPLDAQMPSTYGFNKFGGLLGYGGYQRTQHHLVAKV